MDKLTSNRKPIHREDAKQINLWVSKAVLDEWDTFAKKLSTNRTGLIIASVREFIENHDHETKNNHVIKKVEENIAEIKAILDKKEDQSEQKAVIVNDPKLRTRIFNYIKLKASDFDELSFMLDIEPLDVANIIQSMHQDRLVTVDAKGIVHVVENAKLEETNDVNGNDA